MGATDLEAALKIITGPDVTTKGHRLEREQSCHGTRGRGGRGPGEQCHWWPGEGISRKRCHP